MTRRQRRPRRNTMESTLIITSMVDMFTLVLLFLLVFYDPSFQTDTALELPQSAADAAVEKGPRIRVLPSGVEVDGRVVVQLESGTIPAQTVMRGKAFADVIDALVPLRSPDAPGDGPSLVVECDRRVSWTVLGSVLESAAEAGFARYRFAAVGTD